MKLAELLIERAEIQRRIAQLSKRLNDYALVQEGDEPPVAPELMMQQVDGLHMKLEEMIKTINKTNASTEFEAGVTLADAITRRDLMKSRRNVYSSLCTAAQIQDQRYSRKEIKFVTTVDVEKAIRVTDDLAMAIRLLDSRIQAKNWEVEVA